jgi:toxin ParE1/3/4
MIWKSIRDFLHARRPSFMNQTIRKLYDAARSLRQMPHRGRVGPGPGTRELVLTPLPYIIVYAVEPEVVQMFRVLHAAEDR